MKDIEATTSQQKPGSVQAEEGKLIVQDLKQLLSDLASDAPLLPIPQDGSVAVQDFNAELELLGLMSWLNAPWLYCECYLYRFINSIFTRQQTQFWRSYDCFQERKMGSLKSSKTIIVELARWYLTLEIKAREGHAAEQEVLKAIVEELLEICLWGNSIDLLLLATKVSIDDLQKKQGQEARTVLRTNIVSNNTEEVWDLLSEMPQNSASPREIHIILDNAGFEFIGDLILITFLLSFNFAHKVVIHGKDIPWFISDVTSHDLEATLQTLENPAANFTDPVTDQESAYLKLFASEIRRYFNSGKLEYKAHPFWTTQHSFARMASLAPELLAELRKAELVIFKGDLNYRKLVMDGRWPRTTTFEKALGPLASDGMRILVIRTVKADVVVGLREGWEEEFDEESLGKYGVINYFDGKAGKV